MLLLIAIASGFVVWLIVILAHYNGWKQYDSKYNTAYRFNEGVCSDCFLFKVPKWLQGFLRKFEKDGLRPNSGAG